MLTLVYICCMDSSCEAIFSHHLLVVLIEDRAVDQLGQIHVIASRQVEQRLGNESWQRQLATPGAAV